MTKIPNKLTTIIIILLGLLVTTPALFADPAAAHRRKPAVRQEMVRRPHRRLRIFSFLNRIHRKFRRKVNRQARRQTRANREHQYNNYNQGGHHRP